MTAQEFHKILEEKRYSYIYEDNVTTINYNGFVHLYSLEVLPNNINFNNKGNVSLYSLEVLPDNISFNNNGHVSLNSLELLPDNIIFNNKGNVYLYSLKVFNEDFKNINKIIVNDKKVYAIIAEFEILINYLYNAYNIDYINKINNRYYIYTK